VRTAAEYMHKYLSIMLHFPKTAAQVLAVREAFMLYSLQLAVATLKGIISLLIDLIVLDIYFQ
jgi:hypothetical protein